MKSGRFDFLSFEFGAFFTGASAFIDRNAVAALIMGGVALAFAVAIVSRWYWNREEAHR